MALYNLAYAYEKKGEYAGAKEFALQAQILAPNDRRIKALLRKISRRHLLNRIRSIINRKP